MPKFYYYDDDPIALKIFEEILQDQFEETIINLFSTTENAVQTILETKMDILFLDIHINPHDGLTIFERVHQKNKDLPIVFISAGILAEEVEWARVNGLTACMEKPISTDNLLNLIHDILDGQDNRFRFIRSTF